MSALWNKAGAAARTARRNLADGDADAAVNRAYYAMFGAARAALRQIDPQLIRAKRHATILNRFSQHVVRDRGFDPRLGRAIYEAFEARSLADYDDGEISISLEEARRLLDLMDEFLLAVAGLIQESDR